MDVHIGQEGNLKQPAEEPGDDSQFTREPSEDDDERDGVLLRFERERVNFAGVGAANETRRECQTNEFQTLVRIEVLV